jgi:RNA polymerase sigma-70 factor (ECF subfamily)
LSLNTLVRRAKTGDAAARRQLAERMRLRLERMAMYYASRSGEEFEDLLGEAWLTFFQALSEVDFRIGTPAQYLLKRARWRILDVIKGNKRRRHAPLIDLEDTYRSTEDSASDGLAGAAFDRIYDRLTDVQRLILRDLMEGYTWREIGARRGFSSANVAYHIKRIREIYFQVVGDREFDGPVYQTAASGR